MYRLYRSRPVRSTPRPSEQRSAKVIELRVRRESGASCVVPASRPSGCS